MSSSIIKYMLLSMIDMIHRSWHLTASAVSKSVAHFPHTMLPH